MVQKVHKCCSSPFVTGDKDKKMLELANIPGLHSICKPGYLQVHGRCCKQNFKRD